MFAVASEYRVARLVFENGALTEIQFARDELEGAMLTVEQITELVVLSKTADRLSGIEPVKKI